MSIGKRLYEHKEHLFLSPTHIKQRGAQKIEEQQELAKAFGEEAFRLAHNLPDDGSGRKVAVHAIIGGIMSQITGAEFASGAIGAGVNEAIIGEIKKIKDPGTAQIVSAIGVCQEFCVNHFSVCRIIVFHEFRHTLIHQQLVANERPVWYPAP